MSSKEPDTTATSVEQEILNVRPYLSKEQATNLAKIWKQEKAQSGNKYKTVNEFLNEVDDGSPHYRPFPGKHSYLKQHLPGLDKAARELAVSSWVDSEQQAGVRIDGERFIRSQTLGQDESLVTPETMTKDDWNAVMKPIVDIYLKNPKRLTAITKDLPSSLQKLSYNKRSEQKLDRRHFYLRVEMYLEEKCKGTDKARVREILWERFRPEDTYDGYRPYQKEYWERRPSTDDDEEPKRKRTVSEEAESSNGTHKKIHEEILEGVEDKL